MERVAAMNAKEVAKIMAPPVGVHRWGTSGVVRSALGPSIVWDLNVDYFEIHVVPGLSIIQGVLSDALSQKTNPPGGG